MDVDPAQKYIVSAGQDKKLSIYTINQPKVIRSYKTDVEAGEVLKVSLDPAGVSILLKNQYRLFNLILESYIWLPRVVIRWYEFMTFSRVNA